MIAYDVISVAASAFLAILIRYDFRLDEIPEHFLRPITDFLGINILLTLLIFLLFQALQQPVGVCGRDGAAESGAGVSDLQRHDLYRHQFF